MINLLPQSEKKLIKNKEKEKISLILEIIIFNFFLSLILILFSIKIYTAGLVESEKIIFDQTKKELETSEFKDVAQRVNLMNKNFSNLKSFYDNQNSVISVIEKLFQTLPDGIYLTSFSYTKNDFQINISGFSGNRDILIEFKNNLEKNNNFEKISFPESTWINATGTTFNLNFKFKNEN
jgi:hypothetical protein